MKNYNKKDYGVNRYNGGIVYLFNDETKTVTLEDFINEGFSKEDFKKFKNFSDENFKEEDRNDYNNSYKKTSHFNVAAKDNLDYEIDDEYKSFYTKALIDLALDGLTEKQRKRYMLWRFQKKTMREIALIEGVNHKAIVKSTKAARLKIVNFLLTNMQSGYPKHF